MRKVITLFVSLMVLFCAKAFADPGYIGTWANVHELNENDTVISAFRLLPDQTAFFLNATFAEDESKQETAIVCSWEYIDDSSFRLLDGSGQVIGSFYMLNKNRVEDGEMNMFVKISFEVVPETEAPSPSPEPHGNLQDGVLIDPGQYIVGVDFPSGYYRFEYNEGPADIYVHKDPDSSLWSGFASVTSKHPVFAKLYLPEGARVDVGPFPVIIMYAKALDLGE